MNSITTGVNNVTDAVSNALTAPTEPVAGADVTAQLRLMAALAYVAGCSVGHYNEARGASLGVGVVKIW